MRAIILPLLAAALVPAFTAPTYAGTPAPSGKAPVSTADSAWSSTILGFGVKTNDKYTEGNVFLTVPLMSTIGRDGKLGGDYIFIEPYSSLGDGGEVAASLGLAWRHLFSNQSVSALQNKGRASFMEEGWFLGGNLFIDMLDTQYDNQFWQLGVGAEVGNRYLQLTGNYYIPLTGRELADRNVSTQSFSNTSNSTKLTSAEEPFAAGNAILQNATYTTYANTTTTTVRTVTELYEKGMEGWDIQVAALVPWLDQWADLKLIGGYFSFDNQPFGPQKGGTGKVHGWKAGAEFRPVPAVLLSAMWYQDERLTGNDWTMGLQLQVPLGKDWKDSFKPRRRHLVEQLAEPVHRQNDAVKIGNEKEVASTSSVKRTTRVVKQSRTRLVLKDDIIFVNNGPAVGNGIQAGSPAGTGKAEAPVDTVQTGADLAGTNSSSSNRLWTAYVQGGAADYSENVDVTTGSVSFVASGPRGGIPGVGGKTFGIGGASPLIDGDIYAGGDANPLVKNIGVRGFVIEDGSDLISITDVPTVNIVNNLLRDGGDDAIVINSGGTGTYNIRITGNTVDNTDDTFIDIDFTGTVIANALISGNTVSNIDDNGIELNAGDDARVTLNILGNSFTNIGDNDSHDTVKLQTNNDAIVHSFITGNTITNALGDAVQGEAEDKSSLFMTVSQNTIDTTGDDGIYAGAVGDAYLSLKISGNTIKNVVDSGIDAESEESGLLDLLVSGNTITNPGYHGIDIYSGDEARLNATITSNTISGTAESGIYLESEGDSKIDAVIKSNSISDIGEDGLLAEANDDSKLFVTFSQNTITNPSDDGIDLNTSDASKLIATISGNTITGATEAGITLDSEGTSVLEAMIKSNNISNAGEDAFRANAFDDSKLIVTFSQNTVKFIAGDGIHVEAFDAGYLNLTAMSNTIKDVLDDGLDAYLGDFGVIDMIVTGNTVTNIGEVGLGAYAEGNSELNATIDGNTISGIGAGFPGIGAAAVDSATVNLTSVSSNVIFGLDDDAFGIDFTADGGTLIATKIASNQITGGKNGIKLTNANSGILTVSAFNSNTIKAVYTGSGIDITGNGTAADTNINGTLSNSVAAPAPAQLRLNVNGGASQVNGTIIINGSSVNLNTTPIVP